MAGMTLHLDVASAEEEIYSGLVKRIIATGTEGEFEVAFNHAPLLTRLVPGFVRILKPNDEDELIYISGGVFEVQPDVVTILADTVVRAADFNESEALKAKEAAEAAMSGQDSKLDIQKARANLAQAMGMIRAIQELRKIRS